MLTDAGKKRLVVHLPLFDLFEERVFGFSYTSIRILNVFNQ